MLRLTTMINEKLLNFPAGDGEPEAIKLIRDMLSAIMYGHRRAYMLLWSHEKDGVIVGKTDKYSKPYAITDRVDDY